MPDITSARPLAIGQMARATGVTIESIRYYERIALLAAPDRAAGGNRQYDHDQLKRLTFIKRSRDLGFSIADIRTMLTMVDRRDFTCAAISDLTADHLAAVRAKIADLKRMETALEAMIATCSKGAVPDCPIVDAMFAAG